MQGKGGKSEEWKNVIFSTMHFTSDICCRSSLDISFLHQNPSMVKKCKKDIILFFVSNIIQLDMGSISISSSAPDRDSRYTPCSYAGQEDIREKNRK